MNWNPSKRLGLLVGTVLLVALLLASYSLLAGLVSSPVDLRAFGQAMLLVLSVLLLCVTAYGWWGLANLTYRMERNGIVIRWAAGRDVIPMREIQDIVPWPARRRVSGWMGWPGYRVGRTWIKGLGQVRVYLTRPRGQALLVRTAHCSYLISPANVEGFLTDYRVRRPLGQIAHWPQEFRLPAGLRLDIYRDRLAWCFFWPGLFLNVGLFARLAARYPDLPPRLMLSFDQHGLGDRIGARSELFLLPAVGLAILLLNGVLAAWTHRRERVLSLLLLCNVPLVQVLAWLALSRLVS